MKKQKRTRNYPVVCQKCGWKGTRKVNLPIKCPVCGGNVVWAK